MEIASGYSEQDLDSMLRFAQRPDVHVDSAGALEGAITKRKTQKDKAIKGKNYLRAQDLGKTLEELDSLKRNYPSLTDLMNKEKEMKKYFLTVQGSQSNKLQNLGSQKEDPQGKAHQACDSCQIHRTLLVKEGLGRYIISCIQGFLKGRRDGLSQDWMRQ
jgi:hypothetical protein